MPTATYCIAGRLRMLARIITNQYNDAFTAERVTFAQASLLMHIFGQPGIRQTTLAKTLQIEKSAISRDVQLLLQKGWLTDNLRNGLFLTDEGRLLAKRCYKIWKTLNQQVWDALGPDATGGLSTLTTQLTAHP